jgi:hypothetical protein
VAPQPTGVGFPRWIRRRGALALSLGVLGAVAAACAIVALGHRSGDVRGPSGFSGPSAAVPAPAETASGDAQPQDPSRVAESALTAAIDAALARTRASRDLPGSPPAASPSAAGVSVETLASPQTPIFVRWNIQGAVRGAAAKDSARRDAVAILTAVKSTATFPYSRVELIGLYPVSGPAAAEQTVVEARYRKATLDALDLSTVDPRAIFERADGPPVLDPSMR